MENNGRMAMANVWAAFGNNPLKRNYIYILSANRLIKKKYLFMGHNLIPFRLQQYALLTSQLK